jgi:hypothetical protein
MHARLASRILTQCSREVDCNRTQLAYELGYRGSTSDMAQLNVWLHQAVMEKLAAEGGQAGAGLP